MSLMLELTFADSDSFYGSSGFCMKFIHTCAYRFFQYYIKDSLCVGSGDPFCKSIGLGVAKIFAIFYST